MVSGALNSDERWDHGIEWAEDYMVAMVSYMVTMAVTSIQLRPETRERLARLKAHPRQSYDELLNQLLSLVPEGDDEGTFTEAFRVGLIEARLDVRQGRLHDHASVKKLLRLR